MVRSLLLDESLPRGHARRDRADVSLPALGWSEWADRATSGTPPGKLGGAGHARQPRRPPSPPRCTLATARARAWPLGGLPRADHAEVRHAGVDHGGDGATDDPDLISSGRGKPRKHEVAREIEGGAHLRTDA